MTGAGDARRTALILASSQAIVGSASPICIAIGALAGHYLLGPDKSLATAPVTGFLVGVALGTIPAAAILRVVGQRLGFMAGTLVTAIGAVIATVALYLSGFWLFTLGMAVIGVGGAFVQQFRFAAADNAPPELKARAISFVLAGGIATAIIGPQVVIFTREALAPVMFAGSFVAIVGLAAIGAVFLAFLPKSKQRHSGAIGEAAPARPLGDILMQPAFLTALVCSVSTYALMSFVMTGAPLAMVGCGFSMDQAALGISWHVMAMFGPSFFTGRLIARVGSEKVVAAGLVLLIACAAVALSGIALWQFWTALVLLGLGWNFGFIGATAMVAETYRPSERSRAQGAHDFVLFSSVALASLFSGAVYEAWGWDVLNWIVLPVSLAALAALALRRTRRVAA